MRAELAAVEGRVEDAHEATETVGALGRQLGVEVAAAYRIGQLCVLHRERHGVATLLKDIQEVSARPPSPFRDHPGAGHPRRGPSK
jgi:hypothetical protein